MNYHGRKFAGVENSSGGEVSGQTVFHYEQEGSVLRAHYSGGEVVSGVLIGKVYDNGDLEFRYNHVNDDWSIRGGKCYSRPEMLEDGRIRLHEQWQWQDESSEKGTSIVEEVTNETV
ncbi:n-acetylglutamate synthase [Marinococcus halophilus]|uniref:N-acetylglutamate synthase n=1 Tax=Marinococcus halophilus TaxID=1371 RepID=A0A510Y2J2_MARHA|nr:n-acetylglutamate synthase [Marinococcus halophilus]OZT81571.1 n-acetylglutamate synthase [Marinococcus halophilus]GEK57514.1 hypothetical protein MHA01_04190 [Marinococcus halophilus]